MSTPFPAETFEDYTLQMGVTRARLAISVDLLTDAIVRLGRHRVYERGPDGRPRPKRDIDEALGELEHVRRLLVESLRETGTREKRG